MYKFIPHNAAASHVYTTERKRTCCYFCARTDQTNWKIYVFLLRSPCSVYYVYLYFLCSVSIHYDVLCVNTCTCRYAYAKIKIPNSVFFFTNVIFFLNTRYYYFYYIILIITIISNNRVLFLRRFNNGRCT